MSSLQNYEPLPITDRLVKVISRVEIRSGTKEIPADVVGFLQYQWHLKRAVVFVPLKTGETIIPLCISFTHPIEDVDRYWLTVSTRIRKHMSDPGQP